MAFGRRALLGLAVGLLAPWAGRGADSVVATSVPGYAFRVNSDGLLLDSKEVPIAVKDVPARIKALNLPPGAAMELLIEGREAVKNLPPTVQAFHGQFTKILIKPWQPGAPLGMISLPAPTLKELVTAAYPGWSFGAVDGDIDIPAMLALRPAPLQPGELPPRVRYRYVDNTTIDVAVERLKEFLRRGFSGTRRLWGPAVVVQAGAWSYLAGPGGLIPNEVITFHTSVATRGGNLKLEQALVRRPAELKRLDAKLLPLYSEKRGTEIRALRTDELKAWWPFISYDIIEPVLVWETSDRAHRFIFGFTREGVGMIDDLNGLPDLTAPPK